MSTTAITETPFRVGIFLTVDAARAAVRRLLDVGFDQNQITVICSDGYKEQFFRSYQHQDPAGSHAPTAAAAGGAVGAVLAGISVIAVAGATGGIALLAAAGVSAWAGGVVGGLVGAMMTRGVEKELANFYNQAVMEGSILVAAENQAAEGSALLAAAERIFHELGGSALPMREG